MSNLRIICSLMIMFSAFYFYQPISSSLSSVYDGLEITDISVYGNKNITEYEIMEIASLYTSNPDMHSLYDKLISHSMIKNVVLSRRLPSSLDIYVEEYIPFAKYKKGSEMFVIDKDGVILGELTKDNSVSLLSDVRELITVEGANGNENYFKLLQMLYNSSLYSQIKKMLYTGRRWDILLKNGATIKLPELRVGLAADVYDNILANKAFIRDAAKIDLRFVPNSVFINP